MFKQQSQHFDQQSIMSTQSSRKSSRLSSLNPIKNRAPSVKSEVSSAPSYSPYYSLAPSPSNQSNTSGEFNNAGNYRLTKMETNDSIDSNFSLQQQFKVDLNLSKKGIDLIRFTWTKMLLDEPVVEAKSNFPIPGGFSLQQQSQQASQKVSTKPSASNVATSLFCRQLYTNLLSMDSSLQKMFPSIKHQAVAFAGVLSFSISQLENLSALNDYLEKLGKRHSRILGIEPWMFELMGEAMIQTFHERFGVKFDQELEMLWIKLYLFLANSILQFGIDPVLKLNDKENQSQDHMFRMNEIKRAPTNVTVQTQQTEQSQYTQRTVQTSQFTQATEPMSVPEDKKLPVVEDKKKKSLKKKKRDCVIQ